MFYVYVYRDPRTMLPFYVGKGSGDRMFKHLKETANRTDNRYKYAVIEGLKRKGLNPVIGRYAKNLSEVDAYSVEEFLITKWGRRGLDPKGLLTNRCIDNRPPSSLGRKRPTETRQKISDSKKGEKNWNFGKETSEATKALLREKLSGERNPFFGKTHSSETKERLAEFSKCFHTGRTRPPETGQRIGAALRGRTVNSDVKMKISATLTGRKQTPETIRKRSEQQVGRPRPSKVHVWTLTDPNGHTHVTRSLTAFARTHSLSYDAMRKIENKEKSWKGWVVAKTTGD